MQYHLAQANISKFNAPLEAASMKEFVDFLEPVNRFAEESPGFVWRLKDGQGRSASYIETPFKEELLAINISVWEDIPSFKDFVYGTVHSYFLRNKKKWFDLKGPSAFVMWWIPQGELPTLAMAKDKIDLLEKQGETPEAFSMKSLYNAAGKSIKL